MVELMYTSPTASDKNNASMVVHMSSTTEQMRTQLKQRMFFHSWRFKSRIRGVQKYLIIVLEDKFLFEESKKVSIHKDDVARMQRFLDVPFGIS
ncbi:unnamed protein product [Arabis nemorensis]|uniref:Uncharacterized protein n=1 Tax=Arabis nemorensis TaxID=586526 RepID=A0A565ARC7_9BRAS|nr:unnamed protein product [Arabis nemorensis]